MLGLLPLGLERILFLVRLFAEFNESNIFPTQNPTLSEKHRLVELFADLLQNESSSPLKVSAVTRSQRQQRRHSNVQGKKRCENMGRK